jgi:hypothetical protein
MIALPEMPPNAPGRALSCAADSAEPENHRLNRPPLGYRSPVKAHPGVPHGQQRHRRCGPR